MVEPASVTWYGILAPRSASTIAAASPAERRVKAGWYSVRPAQMTKPKRRRTEAKAPKATPIRWETVSWRSRGVSWSSTVDRSQSSSDLEPHDFLIRLQEAVADADAEPQADARLGERKDDVVEVRRSSGGEVGRRSVGCDELAVELLDGARE